MQARYYVKSSDEGAEKGPFSTELIRESVGADRLRDTCLVRAEGTTEWISYGELIKQMSSERDTRQAVAAQAVDERLEKERRASGNNRMILGIVAVALGVLFTIGSYSSPSSGGRYVGLSGLVVFGISQMIRARAQRAG